MNTAGFFSINSILPDCIWHQKYLKEKKQDPCVNKVRIKVADFFGG